MGKDRRLSTVVWPGTRLARIALVGVLSALAVVMLGRALEWGAMGRDGTAARGRVREAVRADFDAIASQLRDVAQGVDHADDVVAVANGEPGAAMRLFEASAAALVGSGASELAVSVYGADGTPVAWAGGASDLAVDRVLGPESWFVTTGRQGLRLVYVVPMAAALTGRRAGAIAVERVIGRPAAGEAAPYRFATRVAPVTLSLSRDGPVPEDGVGFDVVAPSGQRLLTATLSGADLTRARERWRSATASVALAVLALALVLMAGSLLEWRGGLLRPGQHLQALAAAGVLVGSSRMVMYQASPAAWYESPLFSAAAYASTLLRPLLASPIDFLLTAATAGSVVGLCLTAVEGWRVWWWHRRRSLDGVGRVIAYVATQLVAGAGIAVVLVGHEQLLRDSIANTTLDLLHFSLHPWDTARIALQLGFVVWHAAVLGGAVLLLRVASVWWRVPRRHFALRALTIVCWVLPIVGWRLADQESSLAWAPSLVAGASAAGLAMSATRLAARYRHGSQAFRLTVSALGVVIPALVFYPTFFQRGWQAKAQLVETRYAQQALSQRQTTQALLQEALGQIDRLPQVDELVAADAASKAPGTPTDRAYQVWRATALATYPVTSSVELYGPDDGLVSRFALNLPEDLTAVSRSDERTCSWDLYEEVSPFFAEERRVLHAGRAVCDEDGMIRGSIVVHAMLDYANLPFILSSSPYIELLRQSDTPRGEGISGGDVEFAVYGWSRARLYASSAQAWPLDDAVFSRIEQSRDPIWAELERAGARYDAHILNDRGGIYVLAFPVVSSLSHLVNLAELTILSLLTYAVLLAGGATYGALTQRSTTARALLREIRISFYRKLLLAFMAATVVPVVALALATRSYVAEDMRRSIEEEAVRTASAARRVVEDLVAPRAAQQGVDDNLMVWVSRLIDQDVNLFRGSQLLATSERNLFASGLLPTRTPSEIYRAVGLGVEAAAVVRERAGDQEYLVAGTPMSARQANAILTVPFTSRQQDIEGRIDTMDRRILLGALLFVFGGAGLGYWLAERIADPVGRLMRATRRIARGDLDARVAARSSDEFRRLVEDFNRMAEELKRRREELERTNRLEAWAEMARQVAHDIKNPLTPIQLNAEHLIRVHADKGEPLGPVLRECLETILSQVRLLRQIASEFSSFASSPTARRTEVNLRELVLETLAPYQAGLRERMHFRIDLREGLPAVFVDRTLIGRALTNLVENALHAMPGGGTLTVTAQPEGQGVGLDVVDTGAGMDQEALVRAFEPYFSTKASGTGLGLPIAKRNVEISGGRVSVTSEKGRGTAVHMWLPATHPGVIEAVVPQPSKRPSIS